MNEFDTEKEMQRRLNTYQAKSKVNIEAGLFGRILLKINEIAELLGYRKLQIKTWKGNNNELEFLLADGESKEEFRIVLPKVKE